MKGHRSDKRLSQVHIGKPRNECGPFKEVTDHERHLIGFMYHPEVNKTALKMRFSKRWIDIVEKVCVNTPIIPLTSLVPVLFHISHYNDPFGYGILHSSDYLLSFYLLITFSWSWPVWIFTGIADQSF